MHVAHQCMYVLVFSPVSDQLVYIHRVHRENGRLKGWELQASTFQSVLLVKPNGNSLKYLRKTRCTVQILPWRRLAPFNYIIKHHTNQRPVVQSRRQIKVPEAYKSKCKSQLYIFHNCSQLENIYAISIDNSQDKQNFDPGNMKKIVNYS